MNELVLNKTEESIFTLLSLFILIDQAFQSIVGEEDILNSEFERDNWNFHNLVTDTIYEALVYQILLKTCAFIDEWNKTFGVNTEPEHKETILRIKAIVKPATKPLNHWKQLREFRNEVIAHNHRDKAGRNIYLTAKSYETPNSVGEIYLMAYCLKKMMEVVRFFFLDETQKIVNHLNAKFSFNKFPEVLSEKEIKMTIKDLDDIIDGKLSSIYTQKANDK